MTSVEIMKEEANTLAGKTKGDPPVLSTENQRIKQPEDKRQELRKKEDRSERERESRVCPPPPPRPPPPFVFHFFVPTLPHLLFQWACDCLYIGAISNALQHWS